ncbi:MAG: 5-(carboxyamino)imidazole ribonucleotide mutase [Chloroflexi bacterium HGW-Chloroflexi-4]|nr:MAG: 5-(carboxyamino)imidazole ribonucleotide mutase [Chloroflexi bacterium HGW-Chloroflexi-4]
MTPLLVILMGSKADLAHAQKITEAAKPFGFDMELRIGSAHKTASHVLELLKTYESDPRPKVYITIAGRSNALSGFTDGCVSAPVIACPPTSDAFGGADIYSSLRIPSGIAPALVLEPANAALLAAKMIGISDSAMRERVKAFQSANQKIILNDDQDIQS